MTFRDAVSHLLVSEGLLALAISRLEDGELNSRGFSNPWKTSRFNYRTVCKDGGFQYRGTFKSPDTLPGCVIDFVQIVTLGIAQARLALLSLNRNFPDAFER